MISNPALFCKGNVICFEGMLCWYLNFLKTTCAEYIGLVCSPMASWISSCCKKNMWRPITSLLLLVSMQIQIFFLFSVGWKAFPSEICLCHERIKRTGAQRLLRSLQSYSGMVVVCLVEPRFVIFKKAMATEGSLVPVNLLSWPLLRSFQCLGLKEAIKTSLKSLFSQLHLAPCR